MMLITIVSVYESNLYFKPPMPPDIDLQFILQNREFYDAFKYFLIKRNMKELEDLLSILLNIRIMNEKNFDLHFQVIKRKVANCEIITSHVKNEFINGLNKVEKTGEYGDLFSIVDSYCYNIINTYAFNEFKQSEDIVEAQVNYLAI